VKDKNNSDPVAHPINPANQIKVQAKNPHFGIIVQTKILIAQTEILQNKKIQKFLTLIRQKNKKKDLLYRKHKKYHAIFVVTHRRCSNWTLILIHASIGKFNAHSANLDFLNH
jgi:hypothetical protein